MELTVPLAALSFGGADVGTLLDRFGEMQNAIACLREASLDWLLNNVLKSMSEYEVGSVVRACERGRAG